MGQNKNHMQRKDSKYFSETMVENYKKDGH